MKSVSVGVVFTGCLLAGVSALAAQEQSGASMQVSSTARAQAAVALVNKQYTINALVNIAGSNKPLPKNGSWGARQAHGTERVADCEIAGSVCLEVVYRAGQPEVSCGWTVLFPAGDGPARVVNLNDAAAMYALRSFNEKDSEIPKKVTDPAPVMPPIAKVAHMSGTVMMRVIVDATGKVQAVSDVDTTNPMFNNSAIEAVAKWQMGVFTLNGRALPYQEKLTIHFSADGDISYPI